MNLKYSNLFMPLKVRGVILKNRMISSASTPHFLQGREPYPTEKIITHFANRALNGAAAISINHLHQDDFPFPGRAIDNPPGHFNLFDIDDYTAQNYFCQLLDAVHFYGSRANAYIMPSDDWVFPGGKRPEGNLPELPPMPGSVPEPMSSEKEHLQFAQDDGMPQIPLDTITAEMMDNYKKNIAKDASDAVRLGFDIVSLYACYRNSVHARLLSPLTNTRTDEYGGQNVENRSRFLLDIFREVRSAVGPNVPLEAVISVCDPDGEGCTVEDTIEFCKLAEGLIDIIHLRSGDMDPQHPLGFTSREDLPEPYWEEMGAVCQAVHSLGLNIVIGASAGFFDPERANRALEEGRADLIYMARSWISNPDYGKLVFEGREDEIIPCIRCNKCHVPNGKDMWRTVCSVNPILGFEDKLERMISAPSKPQNVAVVGGGPAGMEFARVAAERGHSVTLYEASARLGGQLRHADYPSFKWPLRQFKDFMIAQMERLGVEVYLDTKATPELLSGKGYDVIAVALGARPSAPPIPGMEGNNVHFAMDMYGGPEHELSDDIVLVGGGEIGVETALYLCELGKKVKVLEMLPELIADAPHAHYKNMVHNYWMHQENFSYQCGVKVTSIDPDGVNYLDWNGEAHKDFCGDVLVAIGSKPLSDEAMRFAGIADRMMVMGDCDTVANVQKAMRAAWALACTV